MEYRNLGRSGLSVSKFGYGNWINCKPGEDSQKLANELVKAAWDAGINFFDTAEYYGKGEGERQMGAAIKALGVPRSDYVLTTKLFWGTQPQNTTDINLIGTSRKRIIEGFNRSLKNLGHDYVDVLLLHRYDYDTPTSEVVLAIKSIIKSGKALYWGTSTGPSERIMEAIMLADKYKCPRPIVEQCQYNMFHREDMEKNLVPLFDDYGIGTTVWSPLDCGILTGKYNNGIPEGSRLQDRVNVYNKYFGSDEVKKETLRKLNALADIAKELEASLPQLAIAWTLYNNDTTLTILGATSVSQLQENIKGLEIVKKFNGKIETRINEILGNLPVQDMDYRLNWFKRSRRKIYDDDEEEDIIIA